MAQNICILAQNICILEPSVNKYNSLSEDLDLTRIYCLEKYLNSVSEYFGRALLTLLQGYFGTTDEEGSIKWKWLQLIPPFLK